VLQIQAQDLGRLIPSVDWAVLVGSYGPHYRPYMMSLIEHKEARWSPFRANSGPLWSAWLFRLTI